MAVKSNTVELVLKARDEMSLVYKDIIKLSGELETAQKSLKTSFFGSSKASADLAKGLDKAGNASKGIDKLASAIDKLVNTEGELEQLTQKAGRLKTALAELKSGADLEQAAGVDPKIAADYEKLATASEKASAKIKASAAALDALKASATAAALAQNRGSLEKAVQNQNKITASYEKQQAALNDLIQKERSRRTNAVVGDLAKLEKLNRLYAEQSQRLDALAAARGKDGQQTATQIKQLAAAQARLEKYAQQQEQLAQSLQASRIAHQAFNHSVSSSSAVAKQLAKLEATAQSSKDAAVNVKRLSAALETVQFSPTTAARIEKLSLSLEELQSHYAVLTHNAEKAKQALKSSLGPIDKSTENSLRELNKELDKTQRQMTENEAQLEGLQHELTEAGVDTKNLGHAQRELASSAEKLKKAQTGAGKAARNSAAGTKIFGIETRKALGPVQRIRGEILALASAYIGLYGVANQVQAVFNKAGEQESIGVRLGVFFDGDTAKVAEEMAFIDAEAKRLKLSMIGLGTEYSKFVAGLPKGQIELEQTRSIFSAYAQSARVLGLSNEELQRVFKALTQIISKGTLSAEELRQQLGDNLAGAVQVFAQGMGYAADETDQFFKAIESGQVNGVDSIIKSVDVLNAKFGAQLPEALKTSKAALGDFQRQVEAVQLEIAGSGFLDTLTEALKEAAIALKDPETVQGLKDLAEVVGVIITGLVELIPYMDELAVGLGAVVAVGLLKYLAGIVGWVVSLGKALGLSGKGLKSLNGGLDKLNGKGGLKTLGLGADKAAGSLGSLLKHIKSFVKGAGPLLVFFGGLAGIDHIADAATDVRKAVYGVTLALLDVGRDNDEGLFKDFAEKSVEDLTKVRDTTKKRVAEIQAALTAASAANDGVSLVPGVNGVDLENIATLESELEDYRQKLFVLEQFVSTSDLTPKITPETLVTLSKTKESVSQLASALTRLANTGVDSSIARINEVAANTAVLYEAQNASGAELEALESARVFRVLEQEKFRREQLLAIRAQETQAKLDLMRNGESEEKKVLEARRALVAKLAEDRIKITAASLATVKAALASSLRNEQQHAEALKGLQEGIGSIRQRHAQALLNLERSGMNEAELQASRRKQLAALTAQAEKALAEGRFKDAAKLALEVEKQTEAQGKANIQAASQSKSALTGAIALGAEARKLQAAQALSLRIAQASAEAEQESLGVSEQRTIELGKRHRLQEEQLKALQGEAVEITTEIDAAQVKAEVDRAFTEANKDPLGLDVKLNDKVVKAALKELTKPLKTTLEIVVKTTGSTDVIRRATGGPVPGVPGFAGGGDIRGPGTSTSDSILARLSTGEFVLNAKAVRLAMRTFGKNWLHDLNDRRYERLKMPRFATGGPVGRVAASSGGGGRGRGETVTLDLSVNQQPLGSLSGGRDTVNGLITALNELRR
ncbi:MAG: tape measure protein [Porticoccaceae bacterium]|nr:tape measure protein [Porticoccaceae bacterium]